VADPGSREGVRRALRFKIDGKFQRFFSNFKFQDFLQIRGLGRPLDPRMGKTANLLYHARTVTQQSQDISCVSLRHWCILKMCVQCCREIFSHLIKTQEVSKRRVIKIQVHQ
jgi:hypothetical protein